MSLEINSSIKINEEQNNMIILIRKMKLIKIILKKMENININEIDNTSSVPLDYTSSKSSNNNNNNLELCFSNNQNDNLLNLDYINQSSNKKITIMILIIIVIIFLMMAMK